MLRYRLLSKRIDDKTERIETKTDKIAGTLGVLVNEVRHGFKTLSEKRLSKIEKDIEV